MAKISCFILFIASWVVAWGAGENMSVAWPESESDEEWGLDSLLTACGILRSY